MGKPVERKTLTLTGQPYRVRHLGAHPVAANSSSGLTAEGGRAESAVPIGTISLGDSKGSCSSEQIGPR